MGKAERALIDAKIEITKLKKLRNAEKGKAAKKMTKRIKEIEDSFSRLNRNVYLEKKQKQDLIKKPSEEDIAKDEAKALQIMIEKDIQRRTIKPKITADIGKTEKSKEVLCPSCNSPLRDVYGIIRCKCN